MKDVLIPLGLLLFICIFIFTFIHTARKQRKAKSNVFRDFADKNRLNYQEECDGKVQALVQDFDGIGRFYSPSLGKVIPKDVVDGILNGSEAILFRHSIHFSEGWAREWFVVGVTSTETIAKQCSVQFFKGRVDKNTMYLQDPIVQEKKVGSFNLVVRAPDLSYAGKIVDEGALNQLADLARNLSFRPEIQVRGTLIIAYIADRNATVDDVETLMDLFLFTESVANI